MPERILGDYPIAIGTAAALASLEVNPTTEPGDWLINLHTLVRNHIDSYDDKHPEQLPPSIVLSDFLADIRQLKQLALERLPNNPLRIYYPTYASLKREFPNAAHKEPHTPLQLARAKIHKYVVQGALGEVLPEKTDCRLPAISKDAYITTHFPADLLMKTGFGELTLVESRTGVFKRKPLWSSKLTGGDRPEVAALPFNRLTIQTFGDNAVQFNSSPLGMKKMLLELAKKSRWEPMTTDDRCRFGISQLRDPFAKRFFLDMFK